MKPYKHPHAAVTIAVGAMVVPYTGLPGEYDMAFHQGLFAANGATAGMMGAAQVASGNEGLYSARGSGLGAEKKGLSEP